MNAAIAAVLAEAVGGGEAQKGRAAALESAVRFDT